MPKIALVTGASRGLGLETARELGRRHGFQIAVGARDVARGERAVQELEADGIQAELVPLDVTDPNSVQTAANRIAERHGKLDVLVNNAGILPEATEGNGAEPVDADMFRKTFETNLFGAVSVVQQMLPLLRRAEAGRIVNVSSTMGSIADQGDPDSPYFGVVVPAYQGSKAALNALTVALAKKLADTPVKVNAVCPGWLQTDLGGPDNRAAAPMTAAEGAEIVAAMACVGDDGPSGAFLDRDGPVSW
jgi:NAD(P)-dependent dehydrogenase (short-subunit alcohol dehydrogenase family)